MNTNADTGKAWLRVAGCVAFAAFGVFLATSSDADQGVLIFGWVVVALFGLIAVMQLRQAFSTGPQLTIDDVGVFDRRITDRYVPWSEIRGLTEVSVKGQRFLYLDVGPDVGRFTDHPGKKALLMMNQLAARGVMINPHGLSLGVDQIRAVIEAKLASL